MFIGLLTTAQVQRLHVVDGPAGSNTRRTQYLLKRLHQLKAVVRLSRTIGGKRAGSGGVVYGLSGLGLAVLDEPMKTRRRRIWKTRPYFQDHMLPGVTLETIGFDLDHLHMVMVIPPKYAIASVMGTLKSQSASLLRAKYPWLQKVYWKENIVWSPGYFVSSVGIDEETIRHYVEHQGQRDSDQLELQF